MPPRFEAARLVGKSDPYRAERRALLRGMMMDEEDAILGKAETTVDLDTNLVADDRAPKRKRKRGKRKAVDVAALIEGESAGAIDWAKKASEGE